MNFIDFASAHGLIIDRLEAGRWSRTRTIDHPHKKNGAYYFSGEFGSLINWATMDEHVTWFTEKIYTPEHKAEIELRIQKSKEVYLEDRRQKQINAAIKAQTILSECELDKHDYLIRKGFPDMEANVLYRDNKTPLLCVPMYSKNTLCGIQTIDADSTKRFLYGQQTKGAHLRIGQGKKIFLVEGFASALSLQEILRKLSLDYTIYVTFSAGNTGFMAKYLTNAFIVADNDASQTAQKMAEASGRPWWMPEKVGFDINDLHKEVGLFKASQIFKMGIA